MIKINLKYRFQNLIALIDTLCLYQHTTYFIKKCDLAFWKYIAFFHTELQIGQALDFILYGSLLWILN